ncbi:BREX system serine/threonine kinase PglW [Leptothoe sp. PORK10 BA2]|uniref:BREX system serine/threonine kinase PglW n=1 Tax=Leptothoe sp. PORK10 BA2 TaxID=3110254 RepID=UPI002B1F4172|nr:BREX system serine/threonine kinase PglW [Leptothoe sp. PORK10 BA2]MEA5465558.1 BREX system serine/threonine kinase PglW [Leptothoe sp. PORK10 BA2]
MSILSNWITVTESNFDHEREALEFIRSRFPRHEPYRAWSNFEFIASDGSINEVDLLVFSPEGFFLIEIKSWPGRLSGDAGTWFLERSDGKRRTYDNPIRLTNFKAKKLKSLLERQRAFKGKNGSPFIEPLVFLSAENLKLSLPFDACHGICLRDDKSAKSGIMAALTRRQNLQRLRDSSRHLYNRDIAKVIGQAMDQAGIRPSKRSRKVSDYILSEVIDSGPGYQDWSSTHAQIEKTQRRIRFYLVRREASADDKAMIDRAAKREFQLLESLHHPGILRAYTLSDHELGPALVLEHDPKSMRLDHYLAQQQEPLGIDVQLDLMRQLAEAMRFAHQQRVIHRGLNPRSILIAEDSAGHPHIKVTNWQLGYRAGSGSKGASHEVTATAHVDRLVESENTAYLAPESLHDPDFIGEHLDIFSLGAIAFYLFSGQPPAANGLELSQKLRNSNGLQISSVINGAPADLQDLILNSTNPNVDYRTESVTDFLTKLDLVEEALTQPENDYVENPGDAKQGDTLPGNLQVIKRLGQGGTSIGFLVKKDDKDYILKVANDGEHNDRIQDEAEVLAQLRHAHIVDLKDTVEVGNRLGLLMQPVLVDRENYRIETLGQRIRKEGPLQIDLLQRFGEDLLDVVKFLDEQGINHRDIKPDNIAIGQVGRGDKLHLMLFDFSLSRAPRDNIKAGTSGYLEPLLITRQPPQWDSYAERYAAAITLYEMATGTVPLWGDGVSDPSYLDCEITLEPERFDAALRERLTDFFETALKRRIEERFDNAEEMLRAWRHCFEGIEAPGALLEAEDEAVLRKRLEGVALETPILELGMGARANIALDRANILTVQDLIKASPYKLWRQKGVGYDTRREISTVARFLRENHGTASLSDLGPSTEAAEASGNLSVDRLVQQIAKPSSKDGDAAQQILDALLGLDINIEAVWPQSQAIARHLKLSQKRVEQLVSKVQKRWAKTPAVTQLRNDVLGILQRQGGVMTADELALALLIARGSLMADPQVRSQLALAVVRAAFEVEGTMTSPRFLVQAHQQGETRQVLVAIDTDWVTYGQDLGKLANKLAQADPLVSPERAIQALKEIELPPANADLMPIPERRLLSLAAAASWQAALSSRQELYPRAMEADRALRLSQGALYGAQSLTVEQIQDRVSGRYPEATPLPGRPQLDKLLQQFIPSLGWNSANQTYVNQTRELKSLTSSSTFARTPTGTLVTDTPEVSPEEADARMLEERLERSIKDGAFLALLVNPKRYQEAKEELCQRFPVQLIDYEALFLKALRQVADKAKVKWELVLQTDGTPHSGDWNKLMLLVGRAMPLVEAELLQADRTILLIYPGLLARYDQMTLLERLREKVGRDDGIPGLWLLLPNGQQATIDGKAVPLLSPGQRAKLTDDWIGNRHRATWRDTGPPDY